MRTMALQNIRQMTRDRKAERDRLSNQGREMVKSWDRDIRMGEIKKAILSGKDVVKQTLVPGALLGNEGARRSKI